jgi:hypothetical protein
MRASFRNHRPRSISAAARLTEARRILANLADRGFSDAQIGRWIGADPVAIARWRIGTAAPSPAAMAALRRYVKVARHV